MHSSKTCTRGSSAAPPSCRAARRGVGREDAVAGHDRASGDVERARGQTLEARGPHLGAATFEGAVDVERGQGVRCERGAIWDVALDLRPQSKTYLGWTATELYANKGCALIIPKGCAHGFITLEPTTQVLYMMGAPFVEELARGVRWNDPTFNIQWPMPPTVLSNRDANYPDYKCP